MSRLMRGSRRVLVSSSDFIIDTFLDHRRCSRPGIVYLSSTVGAWSIRQPRYLGGGRPSIRLCIRHPTEIGRSSPSKRSGDQVVRREVYQSRFKRHQQGWLRRRRSTWSKRLLSRPIPSRCYEQANRRIRRRGGGQDEICLRDIGGRYEGSGSG